MIREIQKEKVQKINPLPRLWPYNPIDEDTWMYSDFKVKNINGDKIITEWIKNPRFKFNV